MKFIKYAIIIAMTFATSSAFAGESVSQILDRYYDDGYDYSERCRTYSRVHVYDSFTETRKYCVNFDIQKVVNTVGSKRLYVLTSGYGLTGSAAWQDGLVGLFVLKPDTHEGGWSVEKAEPFISVGVNGRSVQEWIFHEFGPNKYGFLGNHEYGVNGGYGFSAFEIITYQNTDKKVLHNSILYNFSMEGVAWCDKNCDDVSGNIRIDKTKIVNEYYPLTITLNGKLEGKKYKNSIYQINYQKGKGYIMPSNYPLLDIEL